MKTVALSVSIIVYACPLLAELTAKSYILDGLVAHWDGIENVSYGAAHNSGATKWTDLTGNGIDITNPSESSFVDNGLKTIRAYGTTGLSAKLLTTYASGRYTVDIAYFQPTDTPASSKGYGRANVHMLSLGAGSQWFGTSGKSTIGFCTTGAGYEYALGKTITVSTVTNFHSFSCAQNETEWRIVADGGANSGSGTTLHDGITTSHGARFNRYYWDDHGLTGIYHAMRVYDRALSADEMKINQIVDMVRFNGANPEDLDLPEGWKFEVNEGDVSLFRELKIRVRAGSGEEGYGVGGTIRVSGGEMQTEASLWCEHNKTVPVRLSASAQQGYAFVGWSGVPDEVKYNVEIETDIGTDVAAVFRSTDGSDPKEYTWVGESYAAWENPNNWKDADGFEGVPAANDSVAIPSGITVTLSNSSPRFASVLISGTLVMTNWTTCLSANAVEVLYGGKITCGNPAKKEADLSRVWIDCGVLTIASGGSINVDKRGYCGGTAKPERGYGPGSGYFPTGTEEGGTVFKKDIGDVIASPSHGGRGTFSYNVNLPNLKAALPYDDPMAPMLPGSGGFASKWSGGNHGGGAVYINASGRVVVNGSITAVGGEVLNYTGMAGSGGSVRIVCQTIAGSGTINVSGGNGAKYSSDGEHSACPASGGCISLEYDTSLQVASDVKNMKLSAASGYYYHNDMSDKSRTFDYPNWRDPEPGTLHFSDAKIVDQLLGNGLSGQIVGLATYERDGDLDMKYGYVRFSDDGVSVTINGNLNVSGTDVRLDIGGCAVTNATLLCEIFGGTKANRLTVTGDLTVSDKARFDVRAAETNGETLYGAYVKVGGTMSVKTNSSVYVWSDSRTPSSPYFEVGSLNVCTGGLVSAARRGGACSLGQDVAALSAYSADSRVTADGAGKLTAGAGHGGKGGGGSNEGSSLWGCTYDDALRPWLPGSGAGGYNNKSVGGRGGGAIIVSATNGTIRVDGTIDASGENANWARNDNTYGGGGAGGTIFLECRRFVGGETGSLLAKGGNTVPGASAASGAGGGGRIAVWCGLPWEKGYRGGRIYKRTEPLTGNDVAQYFSYEGSYSAAGGTASGDYATDANQGGDGTVWFCHFREKSGLFIILK